MACMGADPDSFASALHSLAARFVPRPKSVASILESLHRPRPPETEEEIAACEATARGLRAEALMAVDVTAFTRQALRLPSPSMGPFKGLRSSGAPEDLSPEQHREEVSRQASAVVESRHVRADVAFFRATRDLHRWEFASTPQFDLPQSVLLDMLRDQLDPVSRDDSLEYCRRRTESDLLAVSNLLEAHRRPASLAIAPDNIPRKVLRAGGSGTVLGV